MPETLAEHLKLGGEAYERGDLAAARIHFENALALDPAANVARYNLGVVYRDLELDQEAWVHFIDVLARDGRAAGAFNNLAILEERLGLYQAAETHYRRALAIKNDFPDAHFNLGMLLLRLGRFPEGFRESEWRWKTSKFTPFKVPHPLWDGQPLRGTLLVHSEQGAGDAIQFVRYLPMAAERCDRLIFFCPVNLFSIFEGLPGVSELRGPGEVQVSEFQTYLPLLSLPLVLGTTLDTIPCSIPYLAPQPRTIDLGPPSVPNPRLRVGIAWGGSPTHQNDRHRSCRLRDLAPLFDLLDVAFYSLQVGPQAVELNEPGPWTGRVVDLGARVSDYADTAAVLRQLDLLIAVDTSVVHLAGALGVPTWVMISTRSDWRWLVDREDTPWYPSLRLFRQSRLDDWNELFSRAAGELARLAPETGKPPVL
ncbi:MAG: tetratricopeptide repeat protein [Isosphaeraceae bacterium]